MDKRKLLSGTRTETVSDMLGMPKPRMVADHIIRHQHPAGIELTDAIESSRRRVAETVTAYIETADDIVEREKAKPLHFVGMDEKVSLYDGATFVTITAEELEQAIGREYDRDENGRPVLTADEHDLVRRAQRIREIMRANDLSLESQQRVLTVARERLPRRATRQQVADTVADLVTGEVVLRELYRWLAAPLVLNRVQGGSRLHKLAESWAKGTVVFPSREEKYPGRETGTIFRIDAMTDHLFVIEHDWSAAFRGAADFDGGETRLPYVNCVFEFNISGKRVIASIGESSSGHTAVVCLEPIPDHWFCPWVYDYENGRMTAHVPKGCTVTEHETAFAPVADLVGRIVRAVVIALEAEIVEEEVVRVPHKLNHARERRGKLPLFDYHVVKLARRRRLLPLAAGGEPGTRKRLHFRRGHWRHYDNHKTWIRWQLVGDPDLGFVDHEYRL